MFYGIIHVYLVQQYVIVFVILFFGQMLEAFFQRVLAPLPQQARPGGGACKHCYQHGTRHRIR